MAQAAGANQGDFLEIETDAGLRVCHIDSVNTADAFTVEVTTGMGVPRFAARTVTVPGGLQVPGVEVSTGNPHFVIVVDNQHFAVDGQRWQSIGQQICGHPDFPHQSNVEFVRIVHPNEIEIRIFERGVGPTTSSGTGTSASATAAIAFHRCVAPLRVIAPGGAQTVAWDGPETELMLTGPAALIARGEAWAE
jgi:diaminopimelate epimerase